MATTGDVSKKIRAAIKAKLEELGVYVDDELPDYIMVMIANKKEKGQMKDDLLLLFDIFERLQSAGSTAIPEELIDKHKESDGGNQKKDLESSHKRENEEVIEKSKWDGGEHAREHEKKEKERQLGAKERETRENEKNAEVAKVVKSKPPRKVCRSPVLAPERTQSRRKSGSPVDRRARSRSGAGRERRDGPERSVSKFGTPRSRHEAEERERKEVARVASRRMDEREERTKKNIRSRISYKTGKNDLTTNMSRKRKIVPRTPSPDHSLYGTSDEEEKRLDEEETAKVLMSKKVQSSAVGKLPPEPAAKAVPSQVVVKRKLPEKEPTASVFFSVYN
ncbi:unnamed protein product [Gongylonema pulchrum]|uniref:Zinc finger CCCH domain-containing protein 14 n=1 Tax=Gongylonema pulchrum TaxID=637853 RepID=A0A183DXL6_9BILA|nr:unnamed protein product [Gongylonema pulchrum]